MPKYLLTGEEVEEIGRVAGQVLVQKTYCVMYGDEEQYEAGPLELVDEGAVFSDPPKAKLDSEIATKKSELQSILEAIAAARRDLSKAERESKERLARLSRFAALEHLEEWLEGRITHYYEPNSFRIIDLKDTVYKDDNERPKRYRLLSLYGKSNGDIGWELSQYSDGSGHGCAVVPCHSYEEAVRLLAESVASWEALKDWSLPGLVEYAHKHSIAVPDALMRRATAYKLAEAIRQLNNYKPSCEKLEAEIASLGKTLARPTGGAL